MIHTNWYSQDRRGTSKPVPQDKIADIQREIFWHLVSLEIEQQTKRETRLYSRILTIGGKNE